MPPRKLLPALTALLFLMLGAECQGFGPELARRDLWMQLNNQSNDTVYFGFDPGTMFSSGSVLPGRSPSRFQKQELLPMGEDNGETGYVGKNGTVLGSATHSIKVTGEWNDPVVYIFTWDGQRLTPVR